MAGLIDISANWTHEQGRYHHKQDLSLYASVREAGVEKVIIQGSSLESSRKAIKYCKNNNFAYYCTVGCHPSKVSEMKLPCNRDKYFPAFEDLITNNREHVKGITTGLDFECAGVLDKKFQKECLEGMIDLGNKYRLPLVIHCVDAYDELLVAIDDKVGGCLRGVILSFNQSLEMAKKFIGIGLRIGMSEVSLQTEGFLKVASQLPEAYMLVGTAFPMRVKELYQLKRTDNDPKVLWKIVRAVASARGEDESQFIYRLRETAIDLFFGGHY